MKYTAMYIDIDDGIFSKKVKPYDAIKEISLYYFDNNYCTTKHWMINPSSQNNNTKPYLHQAWSEIKKYVQNRTVIMFNANFAINTIVKTFEYLINKTKPNTKPAERYFPNLLSELKSINFDFIDLHSICYGLFKDVPSNKLNTLCKEANINFGTSSEDHAKAVSNLLQYIIKISKAEDLIDLKHLSRITLGQFKKNSFYTISENENDIGKVSDKYYYPSITISEDYSDRKLSFYYN